jgi:hypothetical protein
MGRIVVTEKAWNRPSGGGANPAVTVPRAGRLECQHAPLRRVRGVDSADECGAVGQFDRGCVEPVDDDRAPAGLSQPRIHMAAVSPDEPVDTVGGLRRCA